MSEISALFYNGASSRPIPVQVQIDKELKLISISGGDQSIDHKLDFENLRIDYHNRDRLVLSFSVDNSEKQTLEVSDPHAIKELEDAIDHSQHSTWYRQLLKRGWKLYLLLSLLVMALLALAYVYVVPWMAGEAVNFIPRSWDNEIGSRAYEQIMSLEKEDSAKTKIACDFASHIHFDNDIKLQLVVVNEDIVNAFALPDGHVIIYTGIINAIDTPEEFAALLAHESSHVKERHAMKLLFRNIAGYLLISMALSDANSVMAVLVDNAHNLQGLSYSRRFEEEADMEGLQVLKENKIDPNGMVKLFEKLKEKNKINIPEFISTHPLTDERIKYISGKISGADHHSEAHPELTEIFSRLKKK